jgi:tellurite resistance protein
MNSSSWLARLPAGLFAIPVGLFALAAAWRRGQAFEWAVAPSVASALAAVATAFLCLLLVLYAAKCLRFPAAVAAEFTHPVAGAVMATIPLSVLLLVVYFSESGHRGWLALTLVALALQG